MKIKQVQLKGFKRFTDVTITNISHDVRLVILVGPNGCGKSCVFDAFNTWHRNRWKGQGGWDPDYHHKQDGSNPLALQGAVEITFHDPEPSETVVGRKAFYIRSAYRNDPEFLFENIGRVGPAVIENRLPRLIDNDATVGSNYQRLTSEAFQDAFERLPGTTSLEAFREKVIGEIREATRRLFPGLILNSVGNPLLNGTFRFDKGTARHFLYKNLSGGEKAAFDLLLDLIVKRREFDDTVFCIDEPEAHMGVRLQGHLLDELYALTDAGSQLWVATHSLGMLRRARDLAAASEEEVVFLDFERDFDIPQTIEPTKPTRTFWQNLLRVALDDLAELVAPEHIVICEGSPLGTGGKREAVDARCYEAIFGEQYPNSRFLSAGDSSAVESDRLALLNAFQALLKGARLTRLIDRDDLSADEVAKKRALGIKVLSLRHLESYLYDDEVLEALCKSVKRTDRFESLRNEKKAAIAASVVRGKPPDDLKAVAGDIYVAAKRLLKLTAAGSTASEFMCSTLASLLKPGMVIYRKLEADVFGDSCD